MIYALSRWRERAGVRVGGRLPLTLPSPRRGEGKTYRMNAL